MSATIKHKRSGNAGFFPDPSTISLGELFLNYEDGTLYFKDADGNIFFLQATLMSYGFQSANVNGTVLNASQGNTVLTISTTNALIVQSNVANNTINIGLNLNDTYLSNSTIQAATANAVNALGIQLSNFINSVAASQSTLANAYAQANAAFDQANAAYLAANNALNLANGTLVVWNANATLDLANVGKTLYHNTAGVIQVVLPTNANVNIGLGDVIRVITGAGSGNTVLVPAAGVTLRTANSAASGNCNVSANIVTKVWKLEPNIWIAERS